MNDIKDIKGYEGLYAITDTGQVWSYGSKKFLAGAFNKATGYLSVSLRKEGTNKMFLVHRLVAEAFLPRIEGKDTVNHKNLGKTDNNLSNLEWMSRSEQLLHSWADRRTKTVEKKLTDGNKQFIIDCKLPIASIAKMFGVTESHVTDVKGGRNESSSK